MKHNSRPQKQQPKKNRRAKELEWTADKINLVELIYALSFANCINNGNVKIKDIIEAFQVMFSIDLGEYYRAYVEIKRRKLDRSKFIRILLNLVEQNITASDKK